MADPDPHDDTSADYEQFETELLAQDPDAAGVDTADIDDTMARSPVDDLVDAARVERSRVTNAYKTLNTELGLPTQPARPSEFIPRLASELDVPAYIRPRVRRVAEQFESTGVASVSNHRDSQPPVSTRRVAKRDNG